MATIRIFLLTIYLVTIEGPIAPNWSFCQCKWNPWKPWSACTKTCGGGTQLRDRSVHHLIKPNCINFTDCASNDMGFQRRACNAFCLNGGSYRTAFSYYGYCSCPDGKQGDCCEETVTCGPPSRINHGHWTGSNYDYGGEVTYVCSSNYNLTVPSRAKRVCTGSGYWSGYSPTCLYATSCDSSPCKNGATCINQLGDYRCACSKIGWTGKNCETDIQPPVMSGCSANRTVYISNLTAEQRWTLPTFKDPMGTKLIITSNYNNRTSFDFPWGDFAIQYSALKPSNGMQTECMFTIKIRPHPCPAMNAPRYGVVICNNWRWEYAGVCMNVCLHGYTFPPGYTSNIWYTCGASGIWSPPSHLTKCISNVVPPASTMTSTSPPVIHDCKNQTEQDDAKAYYIKSLKSSGFNRLCEDHLSDCIKQNVRLIC